MTTLTQFTTFEKFDAKNRTVIDALRMKQDLTTHLSSLHNKLSSKITNIQQLHDIANIKSIHQSIISIEQLRSDRHVKSYPNFIHIFNHTESIKSIQILSMTI